jgi:hypothetical protein
MRVSVHSPHLTPLLPAAKHAMSRRQNRYRRRSTTAPIPAPTVREMFQYFEEYTYFGPQREAQIAAANALASGGFMSFPDWARVHMKR